MKIGSNHRKIWTNDEPYLYRASSVIFVSSVTLDQTCYVVVIVLDHHVMAIGIKSNNRVKISENRWWPGNTNPAQLVFP